MEKQAGLYDTIFLLCGIMLAFAFALGFVTGETAFGLKGGFSKQGFDGYCHKQPFIAPYYNCPQALQFENETGMYCDGRIVCENGIKEESAREKEAMG